MERLLHYVWKYKLYPCEQLVTTTGLPVTVIDPGLSHTDAGPDFFNAKLRIGNTVWAGSVEIHCKASDWRNHHHHTDKAYDNVILHVIEVNDAEICRSNGQPIPQVVLPIPHTIRENTEWLLHQSQSLPCLPFITQIDPIHLTSWLNTLLSERLERKVDDIRRLLAQHNDDWNEVFYILLTRNAGMGLNNDAFERLAKSLPLRCLQKQRTNPVQIESMLFGQAGMLFEEKPCPYYRLLQREYQFLRHKYQLHPVEPLPIKSLRTRPIAFPHIKLAQLAAIWSQHDTLFSALRETDSMEAIKRYFRVMPSDYWKTHHHFDHASPEQEKPLGQHSLRILLINTIVPLFFAWGERNHQPAYIERALHILESIPPEQNHITSLFANAGITLRDAGDSQALIQLKRLYCEQKKCLYCRIGFRLLKRGLPE